MVPDWIERLAYQGKPCFRSPGGLLQVLGEEIARLKRRLE
jgi:hypothetical protein